MSYLPFLVLVATPEAVTIANRLQSSHTKMTRAAVFAWDGLSNAIPTKISFSETACRLEMPNQQIAEVKPNEIRFYDEIFNQVATLKNQKQLKLPDAGVKVAIVQRDPISWLLETSQRTEFFKEIKQDPRWKIRGSSLVLTDPKKNSLSEVHFDNSYRVTRIKLSISNRALSDWRYRYVSEAEIPAIPATAKVVKGLAPRPSIPQKTDGKTVLFAQKIWRTMSRLEGKKITQISDEGTFQTMYGSGKISESGPKGSWTIGGTRLVVTPIGGSQKSIDGKTDKFLETLRGKGIFVSPIARYIINRQIPFLDMFDRTDEVKLINGMVNIDGKNLSVVSMKKAGIHIRLYVDPKTGQVAKVSSDATDLAGNLVSGTQLKIRYQ